MGGGSYNSSAAFTFLADTKKRSGGTVMGHTAAVRSGRVSARVHEKLDPKRLNRVTNSVMRDSRDNINQPNSQAIAVIFDTTSSMSHIPELMVDKLPKLMDTITTSGAVPEPQILFGAVNDATTNPTAALEVGQFESGNEMNENVTNILLQGGGGGTTQESYDLAIYFLARHTALDCLEKRNKKGYLFIIGDETPYPFVDPAEVKAWIGDDIQAPIPIAEIVEELKQKYDVYWLFPTGTSNFNNTRVRNMLKELFGQNFIILDRPENICSCIVNIIAAKEGKPIDAAVSDAHADAVADVMATVPPRRPDDI